jgi:hypothetical protein
MARKQSEAQALVWDAMDEVVARAAASNQAVIIACRDGPVAILSPPDYRLEDLRTVETVIH